jgi:DNA-directed RNA polymerase subunit RPC12/RpoP
MATFLKLKCGNCERSFKIDPRVIDDDDEVVGCPYCEFEVELPDLE